MFKAYVHAIKPLSQFRNRVVKPCTRSMATSLPHIAPSDRLAPLVIRITGGNPSKFTLQGTNTYLLGSGRERILIDTGQGFPIWAETIRKVLKEENAVIKTVLLTHHHHDHTAGLKDVPREYKDLQAWRYPAPPSNDMYTNMLEQCIKEWGQEIQSLEEGMTFEVPGTKEVVLRVVHAPGHTPDHCVFILEQIRAGGEQKIQPILFAGDAVLGHGTAVFEDLAVYIASLHKMHDLVVQLQSESGKVRIYPAHGEVIEDAAAKLQEYIGHRAQREREVIETLRKHQTTDSSSEERGMLPMDMVKIIYKDYPEPLHAPAENGLKLILQKLEGEGRAWKQNDRWTLNDSIDHDSVKSGL